MLHIPRYKPLLKQLPTQPLPGVLPAAVPRGVSILPALAPYNHSHTNITYIYLDERLTVCPAPNRTRLIHSTSVDQGVGVRSSRSVERLGALRHPWIHWCRATRSYGWPFCPKRGLIMSSGGFAARMSQPWDWSGKAYCVVRARGV
jgi:hypothetical protein